MNSVGIDISKGRSTIAVMRPFGEVAISPFEVRHTDSELSELARRLKSLNGETRVVMEATGNYHAPVAKQLHDAGLYVSVVNAKLVHGYGNNDLRRVKTDRKDAIKLANYCQEYTVAQWLQTWYDLYAKQNIRESTQIQYSYFMNQLVIPQIGEVPLSQLTGLRLQILYQDLRINGRVHSQKRASSGLSPKTVRSVHMFLHAALEQAVRAGIIAKNPTMECKPPKLDRKEMKVIQPEQIGDYLQAAAERNVLPLFFLELTTGLRRGELLALLWSDLDPQNRSVSVTKSVSRLNGKLVVSQPKTQHSIRTLIVPQQAVDLLIQEHSLHPNNPYLFPSPTTGTMYSPETVARIHKRILRDAGLEDCRFHDLRHTFATVALQNGVDIKTLSGMLGHYSSGFTLDTYTHVTRKMQEEAAEKMGQFMEMKL